MATTTEKKMTKAEAFNIALEITEKSEHPQKEEVIAKIAKEIEQLGKKNSASSGKPTAKQTANAENTAIIEGYLSENPNLIVTVTDLIKTLPELEGLSTQKVRPMLKPLIDSGVVKFWKEKGKTYFQYDKNVGIED